MRSVNYLGMVFSKDSSTKFLGLGLHCPQGISLAPLGMVRFLLTGWGGGTAKGRHQDDPTKTAHRLSECEIWRMTSNGFGPNGRHYNRDKPSAARS
jgi:hypothetical protein